LDGSRGAAKDQAENRVTALTQGVADHIPGAPPEEPRASALTSVAVPAMAVPAWFSPADVVPYEIVATEDGSMKALTQPLSAYSVQEIKALPIAKRSTYRIVVSAQITRQQALSTLVQLVIDRAHADPDLDAIRVFAFDRREDADSIYTVGRLTWGPGGRLDGVTPEMAQGNGRLGYAFDIDISEKVGDVGKRPTARQFEIHDALEKELWKDPDEPEEEVVRRVAQSLNMKAVDVQRIHMEVGMWKAR